MRCGNPDVVRFALLAPVAVSLKPAPPQYPHWTTEDYSWGEAISRAN